MSWSSKVFSDRVIKILEELEFKDFKKTSREDFRATLKMGKIEVPFLVHIEFSKTKIQEDALKMFFADLSLYKGAVRGLFIGYPELSKKARETAEKLEVICLDLYELLDSLIDTTNYRSKIKDFFKEELKNYIIPSLSNKEKHIELDVFFNTMEMENNAPVFIEGEVGIGKTTLLKQLTVMFGKKLEQDPHSRIPFLVDLKNYKNYRTFEDFIFHEVWKNNGIKIKTPEAFHIFAEEKRLVILLDNLDKVGAIDSEEVLKIGKEMKKWNDKGVLFIAVAPSGYFGVDFKNKYYFTQFSKFFEENQAQIFKIEQFSLQKIKQRLSNPKLQRLISRNEFLKEICKVPVFLDIFAHLENTSEENLVKFSDIYKESVKQWNTEYLTSLGKETFCEDMAKILLERGEFQLKTDVPAYLENFVQNQYKAMPFSLELLKKDIAKSFFIREKETGKYDFIHSSFLYFFIAKRLLEEIKKANYTNLGLLASPLILRFIEDNISRDKIFNIIIEKYNRDRFPREKGENFFLLYKVAEYTNSIKEMPLNRISTQKLEAQNRTLVNLQLSDIDFKESDFRNTDLRFARCTKIDFSHSIMENTNLSFADFRKSVFHSTNLKYTSTKNSNFSESSFVKTNFFQASLLKTDFSRSIFQQVNLHGILAVESIFSRCELKASDITNADFTRAVLEEAILEDIVGKSALFAFASFKNAKLKNIAFPYAIFHKTIFDEAILENIDFKVLNMRESSFVKANLNQISFKNADLRRANFKNAILNQVDFTGADLRGADFTDAIMDEATRKTWIMTLK